MIRRYDPISVYIGCGEYVGDVEETEDGDYVLFDDHRAIVERLQKDARLGKAVRKAVERMESDHVAGHYRWDGSDEIIIYEGQLDVLRAIDDVLRAEEGGEQ